MTDRTITLYSKDNCRQCIASERKLIELGVEFEHADATSPENTKLAKDLGHLQAPVMTVVENGEVIDHWSGYRPDLIGDLAA